MSADAEKPMSKSIFIAALKRLNELITEPVVLIAGGGGAMILAHNYPLATSDLDAIPKSLSPDAIDPMVKQIAKEMQLPADWLNPYFSTFTHTLPSDYGSRLISVFKGTRLEVLALGREDLLIMKCFAGRAKDVAHARALIKAGADTEFVEDHIETLKKKRIPGADKALDYLDEILGES
ncbi:MAG: hypothetical protein KDD38_04065 [Bdellovibrionales bacterium]|nr:hypothetical protein [Bdellovibrionales bacterium]